MRSNRGFALSLLLVAALCHGARGVNLEWTGNANDTECSWFNASNWQPAQVPTADDVITVPTRFRAGRFPIIRARSPQLNEAHVKLIDGASTIQIEAGAVLIVHSTFRSTAKYIRLGTVHAAVGSGVPQHVVDRTTAGELRAGGAITVYNLVVQPGGGVLSGLGDVSVEQSFVANGPFNITGQAGEPHVPSLTLGRFSAVRFDCGARSCDTVVTNSRNLVVNGTAYIGGGVRFLMAEQNAKIEVQSGAKLLVDDGNVVAESASATADVSWHIHGKLVIDADDALVISGINLLMAPGSTLELQKQSTLSFNPSGASGTVNVDSRLQLGGSVMFTGDNSKLLTNGRLSTVGSDWFLQVAEGVDAASLVIAQSGRFAIPATDSVRRVECAVSVDTGGEIQPQGNVSFLAQLSLFSGSKVTSIGSANAPVYASLVVTSGNAMLEFNGIMRVETQFTLADQTVLSTSLDPFDEPDSGVGLVVTENSVLIVQCSTCAQYGGVLVDVHSGGVVDWRRGTVLIDKPPGKASGNNWYVRAGGQLDVDEDAQNAGLKHNDSLCAQCVPLVAVAGGMLLEGAFKFDGMGVVIEQTGSVKVDSPRGTLTVAEVAREHLQMDGTLELGVDANVVTTNAPWMFNQATSQLKLWIQSDDKFAKLRLAATASKYAFVGRVMIATVAPYRATYNNMFHNVVNYANLDHVTVQPTDAFETLGKNDYFTVNETTAGVRIGGLSIGVAGPDEPACSGQADKPNADKAYTAQRFQFSISFNSDTQDAAAAPAQIVKDLATSLNVAASRFRVQQFQALGFTASVTVLVWPTKDAKVECNARDIVDRFTWQFDNLRVSGVLLQSTFYQQPLKVLSTVDAFTCSSEASGYVADDEPCKPDDRQKKGRRTSPFLIVTLIFLPLLMCGGGYAYYQRKQRSRGSGRYHYRHRKLDGEPILGAMHDEDMSQSGYHEYHEMSRTGGYVPPSH